MWSFTTLYKSLHWLRGNQISMNVGVGFFALFIQNMFCKGIENKKIWRGGAIKYFNMSTLHSIIQACNQTLQHSHGSIHIYPPISFSSYRQSILLVHGILTHPPTTIFKPTVHQLQHKGSFWGLLEWTGLGSGTDNGSNKRGSDWKQHLCLLHFW